MATHDLEKDEVKRLVYMYESPALTGELYSFGSMLLTETQQRAMQIDSKSAVVLGWATAMLALLFWKSHTPLEGISRWFLLGSGAFSLLAVVGAFLAIRSRDDWAWPSDKSWFSENALKSDNEEKLKRYHLRVMHEITIAYCDPQSQSTMSVVRGSVFSHSSNLTVLWDCN